MLKQALLVLSCLLIGAYAAEPQQHPLTNLPAPGMISTGFFFPEHPTKQFPAGKVITAVLGIHNDATEQYNITAIMGSLNSPNDFSIFVQNFTEQIYHQPVESSQELSLEYKFMPDPRLEPRDFVVALTVFYHDAKGQYFSNTFFNQTIEIVEVKKLIDWELIFLFMFIGGLVAAVVYVAYSYAASYLNTMGFVKKSKKTKRTETSRGVEDHDEWVKGTNYDNFKKRKAATAAKAKAS
mmetsp:Transcript_36631/g.81524  ORF Transcript_36631/g.81524 Transcript_36631/m.81524 type:complete len:238 (-) Transcript_36631:670-1383(-)|eukprot:CAMPEP_0202900370 /NCGR_PEP_ID=MMETSP1392-20130828/11335_1 /ASSEMBLY_ACC=CAM_ASM_000868 /TAXON_ID=225041 /ORGANISM="Chlamydomonas chlamydogama, Strain SAG 11-48b" /LENGTH=237 /DNA_ID=CAMNT_0049586747 /DNA_START=141 /DNA_END=854 /DNA_ORIENTATION=-